MVTLKPLRALIADDHELFRKGILAVFAARPGWEVCGEAANGQEAVTMAVALQPDIVVLDLSMPVMNGFQAAKQIRLLVPTAKILVLSTHNSPYIKKEALKVGADAYVTKDAALTELFQAIENLGFVG